LMLNPFPFSFSCFQMIAISPVPAINRNPHAQRKLLY
jgi:hypothetical protein